MAEGEEEPDIATKLEAAADETDEPDAGTDEPNSEEPVDTEEFDAEALAAEVEDEDEEPGEGNQAEEE